MSAYKLTEGIIALSSSNRWDEAECRGQPILDSALRLSLVATREMSPLAADVMAGTVNIERITDHYNRHYGDSPSLSMCTIHVVRH